MCGTIKCQLQGKNIKYTNMCRLNNLLLNSQQITEEIKKEIKICTETNENENTTTHILWDSLKAVLRWRFIAVQAYLKTQDRHQIYSITLHLEQLEKERKRRRRRTSKLEGKESQNSEQK